MSAPESPRMSPLAVPPGFEQEAIDIARRALEDIPECKGADYFVKWAEGALPILVIAFTNLAKADGNIPALGVCLMTVRRGTLSDSMPGSSLLTGERLRDKVLRSSFDYLQANGIAITLGLN
jgi:hypothetical protein